MPRDGSGNYTLPAGNPVVSGTPVESAWANTTMSDLSVEMTDSLSRSGKGALTNSFKLWDNSGGATPGLAFISEPTSGLNRRASGDVRMQIQNVDRMRWLAGASNYPQIWNGSSWEDIVTEGTLGLPSGTKVMPGVGGTTVCYFYNSTPPTGWNPQPLDSQIRQMVIGVAHGTGGSDVPTSLSISTSVSVNLPANTGAHTLTVDQIPAHDHKQRYAQDSGSGNFQSAGVNTSITSMSFTFSSFTEDAGGGASHTHPLGGTAAGTGTDTLFPRYASGVLGTLA